MFKLRQRFHLQRPGQTVVVMALMMVVLLGVIGLSVDVGNVYGQQRRVQSSVDASAIAGLLAVQDNASNATVLTSIQSSMQGHGIDPSATNYTWNAYYIVPDSTNPSAVVAKNIQTDYPGSSAPPANVRNVVVTATELVDSYFARVVGRSNMPAHAAGYACPYTPPGIYPLAVPATLNSPYQTQYDPATWVYGTGGAQGTGTPLPPESWTSTGWTLNSIFKLPVGSFTGQSQQFTGLVVLGANAGSDPATFAALMQPPGKYHPGPADGSACPAGDLGCYHEAPVPSGFGVPPSPPYTSATQANNRLEPYDWIQGNMYDMTTDMVAPFQAHLALGDTMILAMVSANNSVPGRGLQGSNGAWQVAALGKFRLLAYTNIGVQDNSGTLTFQYLGPQQPSRPAACTAKDAAGIR
ncbi:MAG: hypothetical protein NVS2B7_35890 [Herpetosiphon sp.]